LLSTLFGNGDDQFFKTLHFLTKWIRKRENTWCNMDIVIFYLWF